MCGEGVVAEIRGEERDGGFYSRQVDARFAFQARVLDFGLLLKTGIVTGDDFLQQGHMLGRPGVGCRYDHAHVMIYPRFTERQVLDRAGEQAAVGDFNGGAGELIRFPGDIQFLQFDREGVHVDHLARHIVDGDPVAYGERARADAHEGTAQAQDHLLGRDDERHGNGGQRQRQSTQLRRPDQDQSDQDQQQYPVLDLADPAALIAVQDLGFVAHGAHQKMPSGHQRHHQQDAGHQRLGEEMKRGR